MRRGLLAWIGVALLVGSCALPESSPNQPDPLPEGPATSTAPPQNTPSASPTPTPGLGSPGLGSHP